MTKEELNKYIDSIKLELDKLPEGSDLSDIGNSFGFAIGEISKDDKSAILNGVKHGISLNDGTHGKPEKVDPKYMGIPNIQFSLTKDNDDREVEYSLQRKERGFDDSETWCLTSTFCKFLIPRLERYIEIITNHLNEPDLASDANDVLIALNLIVRDNGIRDFTEEEVKQLEDGLDKFRDIFIKLWW